MKCPQPNREEMKETITISRKSYDELMDIELNHEAEKEVFRNEIEDLKEGGVQLFLTAAFFQRCIGFTKDEKVLATIEELKETAYKSRNWFSRENTWLLRRNLWQRIINKKQTDDEFKRTM